MQVVSKYMYVIIHKFFILFLSYVNVFYVNREYKIENDTVQNEIIRGNL